mmetsp:Transcript_17600/g.40904  ORF Transcript_17600/g.40904 Transcript_17600/m.40904 type:complete len:500 (-) Transcript_17600:40-1539(-)
MCGCVTSAAPKKEESQDVEAGAALKVVPDDHAEKPAEAPPEDTRVPLDLSGLQRSIGSLGLASKAQLALITRWWAAVGLSERPDEAVYIAFEGRGTAIELEVPVPAERLPRVVPALQRLLAGEKRATSKEASAAQTADKQSLVAGGNGQGEGASEDRPLDENSVPSVVIAAEAAADGRPKAKAKAKAKAKVKVKAKPQADASQSLHREDSLAVLPVQSSETERRDRFEHACVNLQWSRATAWLRLGGLAQKKRGRAHVDYGVTLSAAPGETLKDESLDCLCNFRARPANAGGLEALRSSVAAAGIREEAGWCVHSVRFGFNEDFEGPDLSVCFNDLASVVPDIIPIGNFLAAEGGGGSGQEVNDEDAEDDVVDEGAASPAQQDQRRLRSRRTELLLQDLGVSMSSPLGRLAQAESMRLAVAAVLTGAVCELHMKVNIPTDADDSLLVDLCVGDQSAVDGITVERLRRILADVGGTSELTAVESLPDGKAVLTMRATSEV